MTHYLKLAPAAFIAAVLAAAALIAAIPASAQGDDANIRVLHASPDAPAVDVYLDGAEAISDLAFDDITGYVAVTAGEHNVQVFPASADGTGDPVIDADVTLTAGADYTIAAVGELASIEPLVLADDNSATGEGKTKLRFVHASPDAPAVDIYAEGAGVVVAGAEFKQASDYLSLDAGAYDLEVRAAGTETVALDLPVLTLEEGNVYTAFALGLLEGTPALDARLTTDAQTHASALPNTGGQPLEEGAGSSSQLVWILAGFGIAIVAGTATTFAFARSRN